MGQAIDSRLAACQPGPGQVEHFRRLHVGEGAEHLLQLGQVRELGKAAARPERLAVRGDLHRVHHFPEGRGPRVKMVDAALGEPAGVEIALDVVHLDHRIAHRRARGEGHAVPGVLLVEIAAFHVEVEGALRATGLDAGDALHFRRRLQVLEIVAFIDEDVVDAQLVEDQAVILLVLGQQVFQAFLALGFLLFDGLEEVALSPVACIEGAVGQQGLVFRDLLAQELLLVAARHAQTLERAMGDDDAIPRAAGDLRGQELAALFREVFLAGDEQLGVGIELHELAPELLQHVIGHDIERFLESARPPSSSCRRRPSRSSCPRPRHGRAGYCRCT